MIWVYLFIAYVIIGIIVAYFVYRDANRYDFNSEVELAIACGLFWLPILVLGIVITILEKIKRMFK